MELFGYTLFFGLNVAMSRHMLHEPPKNAWRLTIIAQHTVTIFSLILVTRAICDLNALEPFAHFHAHLSVLMGKIAILFTGLLLTFALTRKTAHSPVTRRPMTVMRIARNLYCHYGTTAVLWFLEPDTEQINILLHNAVVVLWFICVSSRFGHIYDIEGISTLKVALPIAGLSLLSDGILFLILR